MRKGYWKILLRRLRGRVASGLDTFRFRQRVLTVTEVLASDDDALDPACALPLAATSCGAVFFIDTGCNLVILRRDQREAGESTGLDLPAFIDALGAYGTGVPDLEYSLGDAELPVLSAPQRKSLL